MSRDAHQERYFLEQMTDWSPNVDSIKARHGEPEAKALRRTALDLEGELIDEARHGFVQISALPNPPEAEHTARYARRAPNVV